MKDSSVEVGRAARLGCGLCPDGGATAVYLTTLNSTTCEGDRIAVGEMVATCSDVCFWRASELDHQDDQGLFLHATRLEVSDESRGRLFERGEHLDLEVVEVVALEPF